MMFRLLTVILPVTFAGSMAAAQTPREVQRLESIDSFTDWGMKYPGEKAMLGLFRGFEEPMVNYMEFGVQKSTKARLMMYVVRLRTAVNKPAASINLPELVKLESLRKLDPEIKFKQITAAETMPVVGGKGPVAAFKWCNAPDKVYINLPNFELPLTHLSHRPWCKSDGRTICLESCFLFSGKWYGLVEVVNTTKRLAGAKPEDLKDYGIAMNAEARYYTSEAEFGHDVRAVTKVNTPVRGIVELNIFYVNQIMHFGKILAVLQEHPSSAQATLVSTFVAIGIRESTWKKYAPRMEKVMKGEAYNTPTGLTAGIPKFSEALARAMAEMIEKQ